MVNGKNQVVGVLSSGTRILGGGTLLGFEPIDPSWLPEGTSEHPLIVSGAYSEDRIVVRVRGGVLQDYKVLSPSGDVWSWWPASPLAPSVAPSPRP